MVDSPIHLADFGAALTSADSQQMQAVLECQEVHEVVGRHVTMYSVYGTIM